MVIPPYKHDAMWGFLKSEKTISFAVGDDQHLFGEAFKFRVLA
jgi:hypothetical protein